MRGNRRWTLWFAGLGILAGFLLGLWIGYRFMPGRGDATAIDNASMDQDQYVALVALAYEQTLDLNKARARLGMLNAPTDGQSLAVVAGRAIETGHSPLKIGALAMLARDLGADEAGLQPYLPTATPLPVPPTNTPLSVPPSPTATPPVATPEPPPTSTTQPPTPTANPDTPTPIPTDTPTPALAAVAIVNSTINVRGGPGVAYPVVGSLSSGGSEAITGRDQAGGWWQIDLGGGVIGWVADQVVDASGDFSTVPVIADIAAPPATPTPTIPPPPTSAPKPSVDYVVKSVRLRAIGEHSQRCDSGDHNIYATVVDAAGNRLDGVLVREVYTGVAHATGSQGKGSGNAEWDIYRGGGGALEVVDENGNRLSEVTREMSADWPAFDMLTAAGYCHCKPHPDDASCKADLESKRFFFAVGHYVYEVIFQRSY